MSSGRRTWTLNDLREVRNGLEAAHNKLRDLNLTGLPNAKEGIDHLLRAIKAIKQEIDYGENHAMSDWNWPRDEAKK